MSSRDIERVRQHADPLDESLYKIDDEALEFMKAQTGIQDPEELKKHFLAVQAEAYHVYPYPCIRGFHFLQMKLSRLPAYEQLLTLGKERQGPIFLDIGCCFGNDLRRAVHDGYPVEYSVASDLNPDFWNLGHKLFKSTPETFPVPFIPGDVFDPAHLAPPSPFYSPPDSPPPELSKLTSLNPLRGHVSAIHASALFHLFSEQKQLELAQALGGLLSPTAGSMILGSHVARPEKGLRLEVNPPYRLGDPMFCHSPESWTELWDGQIFEKGTVRVDTVLRESRRWDVAQLPGLGPETKQYVLAWSVTRL